MHQPTSTAGKQQRVTRVKKQSAKRSKLINRAKNVRSKSAKVAQAAKEARARVALAQNGLLMEPIVLKHGVSIQASPLLRIYSPALGQDSRPPEIRLHLPSLRSTTELLVVFHGDTPRHVLVTYETKKVVYNQLPITVGPPSKEWLVPIKIPSMCEDLELKMITIHFRFDDERYTCLVCKAQYY
jgi:hypothetical protein